LRTVQIKFLGKVYICYTKYILDFEHHDQYQYDLLYIWQVVDYERELKVMQNVSKEEYLASIRR
jgi:hypothetical protein